MKELCQSLLAAASEAFEAAGISRPRWSAEQLLSRRLGCQPVELYIEAPPVDSGEKIRFEADVAALVNGVPLQYLTGAAGFYGRDFAVGPGVFIPRPETEVLIDAALYSLKNCAAQRGFRPLSVADIGTGSGAIAVTLALERRNLQVTAVDRSALALWFARCNAVRMGVQINFLQGDLLSPLPPRSMDLIAANLPYLEPGKSNDWPKELAWEPWMALDGGPDGADVIRELIRQALSVLSPGGSLVLEIGEQQAPAVRGAAEASGFYLERVVHDLAGRDRVLVLKEKKS